MAYPAMRQRSAMKALRNALTKNGDKLYFVARSITLTACAKRIAVVYCAMLVWWRREGKRIGQ